MSIFLVILAAGDSKRLESSTPKPFHRINGITLLEHAINAFKSFKKIKKIVVVYNRKHNKYLNKIKLKNVIKVKGGNTRQESTLNALKKISCKKIIIHDAARPSPPKILIKKLLIKIKNNHAVIPIVKVTDAAKRVEENFVFKNIQRDSLRFAQTPQAFTFEKLYKKHKENINNAFDDDSALFTNDEEKVETITGNKTNIKITDKEDLKIFKLLKNKKTFYGIGFDVHRLIEGKKLYLGGIKIPFDRGLLGHSDADPVLHALIDSLLGASRLKDIGFHFPKNKKNKNIRSTALLKKTISLLESNNLIINNIDINIIAQKPKIKKYSNKMISLISKLCKINSKQINIKGKTTEKLGVIGNGNAIASEVITSITKYD